MTPPPSLPAERPYRSHMQPACVPCRRRKSRCKLDAADRTACLMCRVHGTECTFPPSSSEEPVRAARSSRKSQARLARQASAAATPSRGDSGSSRQEPTPTPSVPVQPRNEPRHGHPAAAAAAAAAGPQCPREIPFPNGTTSLAGGEDESHVIGPVQSPDAQLIADYLLSDPAMDPRAGRMIVVRPEQFQAGQRPILFNTVRKHPLGYSGNQTAASLRCEVVEKLIEPYCDELIDVYFAKVHRCFPLLDERTFRVQYAAEKDKISPALLSCLYAQSFVYWRNSLPTDHRCPDLRYIWNQAGQALYSELNVSPGISTVTAVLLNISGRPLTSMIGNGVLLSSAISLAHSLGLNRNCLDWNISPIEKSLRTKLWWAIRMYDKWSSVTYGTPPHLRSNQHDVPVPDKANLSSLGLEDPDPNASAVFVGLATLTDVLDPYLDHVFDLRPRDGSEDSAVSLDIERRLTQWEDSLPGMLRRAIIRGVDLRFPGSPNLRLSYLYIRLLVQKLGLDSAKHKVATDPAILHHQLIKAREAAENIVLFVQELDDVALCDFWLSSNAFALSSTVAFLLRSVLETDERHVGFAQSRHLQLAWDMITTLRAHQERRNWDLGNICVAQYADVLEKLMRSNERPNSQPPAAKQDLHEFVFSDFTEVDQLFPSLWEMFNSA